MSDAFTTLVSVFPSPSSTTDKGEKFQNRPQATGHDSSGLYAARRDKLVVRLKKAEGTNVHPEPSSTLRAGDILGLAANADASPAHTVTLVWSRNATQGDDVSYRLWFSDETPLFDPNTWSYVDVPMGSPLLLLVTYVHTGRTPGATYYYAIQGVNIYGSGPVSPVVGPVTVPLDPPAAPAIVTAFSVATGSAAAWWTPVTGATSYALYHATSPGVTKNSTRIYPAVSPCAVPAVSGQTRYVRVAAIGPGGEGALSAESSAHVL